MLVPPQVWVCHKIDWMVANPSPPHTHTCIMPVSSYLPAFYYICPHHPPAAAAPPLLLLSTPLANPVEKQNKMQPLASNRISRFTYTEGNKTATLNSWLVLLTTDAKFNTIHSAGWLGFKPSDYDAPVSGGGSGWLIFAG